MTIFVDLDGVLADFDAAYEQRFDEPCPGIHARSELEKAKWDKVRNCGDFFLYMPWTQWGREMWSYLQPTGAHILTATPKSIPEAAGQKIQWCRRELGIGTDRIIYVQGKKNKVLYCQKGDVLIDDNPATITAWNEAGGKGLLVTPQYNVQAAELAAMAWVQEVRGELGKMGRWPIPLEVK